MISQKQFKKLTQALGDGYRINGKGEQIELSDFYLRDYRRKIDAYRARSGMTRVLYQYPRFNGPARRVDGGYVPWFPPE